MMTKKTYIRFLCTDNIIKEHEVPSRNLTPTDIPTDAFAYFFYDRIVTKNRSGETLNIREDNDSPVVFIDCVTITIDQIKQLLAEMEEDGDEAVALTPWGEFCSFDPDSQFVSRSELEEKF